MYLLDSHCIPDIISHPIIHLKPENTETVVKATIVLHNYLTEVKDIATLYDKLNPDHVPYMHDDGAILDLPTWIPLSPASMSHKGCVQAVFQLTRRDSNMARQSY